MDVQSSFNVVTDLIRVALGSSLTVMLRQAVLLRQACCRLEKLDFFEVETGKVQPVSLVGKVC